MSKSPRPFPHRLVLLLLLVSMMLYVLRMGASGEWLKSNTGFAPKPVASIYNSTN